MDTRFLKFVGLFFLLTTLTGCPVEEDCNDFGAITRVDDLITLLPLQDTYNQGDNITIKVTIPATNTLFGQELNLFEKTGDLNVRLVTTARYLFNDNQVTYLKGSLENYEGGWSNVTYNNITNNYELEILIKLNKTGNYSFITDDSFVFQGSSKCNRYRLDTNILHNESGPGTISFTVQ